MRPFRRDLHALAAAYALDALDNAAERERFTRHLSRCASCANEVRGFREVATALAFAAAAEVPAGMRDRVLAAAARAGQQPAEVTTHAQPRRPDSPERWVPWLSATVAAAAVVVAVLSGFAQARTEAELRQVRADSQAISALLSSPHVRLLSQGTARGGTATVVLDADRHELAVITTGMAALPPGRVYQLWLIGKQRISSAGLLPAATDGRTAPVLATGVTAGETLGMTVEPAPGTARPTTAPILALPLPA